MTDVDALKAAVDEWGEAHVIVDGFDQEVEIRSGQVEWDTPDEGFTLHVPTCPTQTFRYEDVFSWYEPDEMFH